MREQITIWSRYNSQEKIYEHNHIEFGLVDGDKPKGKFDTQKGWQKDIWKKQYGYLENLMVKIDPLSGSS